MSALHTTAIGERHGPRGPVWRAECSCGWESGWLSAAGLAHGAEAAHVADAVEALLALRERHDRARDLAESMGAGW